MDKRNCIKNYLEYCNLQKCLDQKTLKAYQIDLQQFCEQTPENQITEVTTESLEQYIAQLHEQYRPKTAKRKIASVKALSDQSVRRMINKYTALQKSIRMSRWQNSEIFWLRSIRGRISGYSF